MPKATPKTGRAKSSRATPTTRPPADPKASHLYTDDNPSTTIHGTGFKDKSAAASTLTLIASRSLIYQFQTVNTLYNRAKHHPAMKRAVDGAASTQDMRAAMEVFREWLDVTYPTLKDGLRAGGFKPVVSKKVVEQYLPRIEGSEDVSEGAKQFARVYVELPRGKKLGNVLVDASRPEEPDWEARRYVELASLVPEGKEDAGGWEDGELWVDGGGVDEKVPTRVHLEMIAWAWSPWKEHQLSEKGFAVFKVKGKGGKKTATGSEGAE
ncbi:hypothetical protein Tdes44962_MAKER02766 [Teratosphaeria destructans]|uniref:Uncharacterized protein n=1 Tax=Teratosphaeria destructans TaxID=418781 RepID=A0A9W7SSR0_9PEZI|nr:hypothetical protein Tdes44962_MAKER02766 [Teratosphaeria destructans]